jgi:phage-related protein
MHSKFEVLFLEEAREFLFRLDEKARAKILYNIDKAKILNDPKLFKKLTDTIWEFRTKYNGLQYRLLAFWDKTDKVETLVISTHGFVKKVDKVPPAEINRADQLRQLYFEQKKKGK